MHSSTKRFYNTQLVSSINITGSVYVIIAGSCSSNSNLDRFINAGRLYSVGMFRSEERRVGKEC